jgi:hypothetical protein
MIRISGDLIRRKTNSAQASVTRKRMDESGIGIVPTVPKFYRFFEHSGVVATAVTTLIISGAPTSWSSEKVGRDEDRSRAAAEQNSVYDIT